MNKPRYKDNRSPSACQVWLAYIEYEGSSGGKKRPVLITKVKNDSCTVMEITSQPPRFVSDVPILDLLWAGLERESVIQTSKIRTVPKKYLKGYLGYLSDVDRFNVRAALEGY